MLKIKILFSLAICFVLINTAFAWDDTGHKITAYIAWQQMTPLARSEAIKILRGAPEDSNLSAFYASDSRSAAAKNLELFEIAATWADIVRDRDFKNRYAKYHHGTWHYLDTFWRDNNGKIELLPEMESAKENAVERLFFFDKVLRDASVSNEDKAIALAWILHLGGDIHQPLHASGRVTADEPKGDQGGNLFQLSPPDAQNRLNLHGFWDSIIGRVVPRQNDASDSDYLPAIAQQIMNKYPASAMQSRLDLGKFDDWQQESFRIASTRLYPPTLIRNQPPPDDYKQMAFDISEERLALAGYRLGAMLNQIFGGQTTPTVQTK